MKTKPIERELRVRVLGKGTMRCEKCLADCSKTVDLWVLTGLCEEHAKK